MDNFNAKPDSPPSLDANETSIHAAPKRPASRSREQVERAKAIRQCMEFFDVDQKGSITVKDLEKRLGLFYENLTPREYTFLMNGKRELTEDELFQLLAHNELNNYDPVAEAFKMYDPDGTGFMDLNILKEVLSGLGYGTVTDDDVKAVLKRSDIDADGQISLEDFRNMLG